MTTSLLHRITAISMAMLMLLSATGFSMDAHYCQDQLKGISFIGKATSCHDKEATPPCHKTKKSCQHKEVDLSQADKDNCCHNKNIVIEKSDVDATSPQLASIQDIQLDFVAAFVAVYVFHYNAEADFQSNHQYKPPIPDRDTRVLYQTFLI